MKKVQAEPEVEEVVDETVEVSDIPVEQLSDDYKEAKRIEDEAESIFPSQYLIPLKGLLYLGSIEQEVEYGGHKFLLRTLTEGQILRIGQLIKEYLGTPVEMEARRVYTIAAALVSVDGNELSKPIKPSGDTIYDNAQEVKKWFPAVIRYLHKQYVALETTAINVSDSLKKS